MVLRGVGHDVTGILKNAISFCVCMCGKRPPGGPESKGAVVHRRRAGGSIRVLRGGGKHE